MKKSIASLLFLLLNFASFSQKIENTTSFRDIKSNNYFRFNYDNDYFTATDKNYTQGYSFELVSPYFKTNPANYWFLKPKNSETKYGLTVEHIGFTPANYSTSEILYGDRPFAAAIFLKSTAIATDTVQKTRLVSTLNLGFIGQGAFGKEMQVGIHEATKNVIPMGWHNQIRNDLVLNYEINFEKQLFRYSNLFSLQATSNAKLGTLFTNASLGLNATFGIINSPFTSYKNKNKWQIYFFTHAWATAVGYDATLQGGLFNKTSPYTLSSSEIERFTAQTHYGFILQTKSVYWEYFQTVHTREFRTGDAYKWGGIKIGFKI